jgi:hypothetical protein
VLIGAALAQLEGDQASPGQGSDVESGDVVIDQAALGTVTNVAEFVVGDGAIDLNDLFETAAATSDTTTSPAWAAPQDASPATSDVIEVSASILYQPDHDADQQT